MSDLLVFKIDWNKIDMNLLYRGEKTEYLNGALKYNKDGRDKWGWDGMVTQDVSKEDRLAGVRGPIIGNFKHLGNAPSRQDQPDDRQPRRADPPPRRHQPLPQRPAPGTHGRRQEPEKREYSRDDHGPDPDFQ